MQIDAREYLKNLWDRGPSYSTAVIDSLAHCRPKIHYALLKICAVIYPESWLMYIFEMSYLYRGDTAEEFINTYANTHIMGYFLARHMIGEVMIYKPDYVYPRILEAMDYMYITDQHLNDIWENNPDSFPCAEILHRYKFKYYTIEEDMVPFITPSIVREFLTRDILLFMDMYECDEVRKKAIQFYEYIYSVSVELMKPGQDLINVSAGRRGMMYTTSILMRVNYAFLGLYPAMDILMISSGFVDYDKYPKITWVYDTHPEFLEYQYHTKKVLCPASREKYASEHLDRIPYSIIRSFVSDREAARALTINQEPIKFIIVDILDIMELNQASHMIPDVWLSNQYIVQESLQRYAEGYEQRGYPRIPMLEPRKNPRHNTLSYRDTMLSDDRNLTDNREWDDDEHSLVSLCKRANS